MDEHRFDTLTRQLTASSTRRGSMRILAAAASLLVAMARGKRDAAGQDWYRSAGDPCWDDSQCVAADTALVCANNGYGHDGELNCCTYEGGRCAYDQHCCGVNDCVDGFCRAPSGGTGTNYGGPGPGDPCQNTGQCNRAVTGAICEFTNATQDTRCCWYEGSLCTSGAQCCGSRICAGGVCQLSGGGGGGGGNSCAPERASCGNDWECCGDLVCGNGICRALAGGSNIGVDFGCTREGCNCMLYRDARCRASCQLNDPCDAGLVCTAQSSDQVGVCVRSWS